MRHAGQILLCSTSFATSAAWAGDYQVAYAIELRDKKVTGTLECTYGQFCRADVKELAVSVTVHIRRPQDYDASISIDGRGCCYFSDGTDRNHLDLTQKVSALSLFEGRKRRGMEVVTNVRVGFLYVAVSH